MNKEDLFRNKISMLFFLDNVEKNAVYLLNYQCLCTAETSRLQRDANRVLLKRKEFSKVAKHFHLIFLVD